MNVQNPDDNLIQSRFNSSKTDVGFPKTTTNSPESQSGLTRSESVEKTNKKIGSLLAKIKAVNSQPSTGVEKQKRLGELATRILKNEKVFKKMDLELFALSERASEISGKLDELRQSGSGAEIYWEELKTVRRQIRELEELKSSGYGGGMNLVSLSLQQVQASMEELQNSESATVVDRAQPQRVQEIDGQLEGNISQLDADRKFVDELFPKETIQINESHEAQLADLLSYIPNDRKKEVAEIAKKLIPEGTDVQGRMDVIEVLIYLVKTNALMLHTSLIGIPPDEMMLSLDLAFIMSSPDMKVEDFYNLIVYFGTFEKTERENLAPIVNMFCSTEGLDLDYKFNILNILDNLPAIQRENPVGYAIDTIIAGEAYDNEILPYILENQNFREDLIHNLQEELEREGLSQASVNAISSYVNNNRAELQLDESDPLVRLADLKLTPLALKNLASTDPQVNSLSQTIDLRAANVTKQEAEAFQNALGTVSQPGAIGKFFIDAEFQPSSSIKDITLPNGNILYAGEQLAIELYSCTHYRLINGTLDNDQKNIMFWKNYSMNTGKLATNQFTKEAQTHVMKIAQMVSSGLNKLPPYEGQLYRGASVTNEKLQELRKGTTIMTKKFYSSSTDKEVCLDFSRTSAEENRDAMKIAYTPVLYIFQSKNSKDISRFSSIQEEERLYPPGQGFRSVKVDETSTPGMAIVYMEEMN